MTQRIQTRKKPLPHPHKQIGTTAFFVLTSEKPEYNDKIVMMHALAPIAYLTHTTSPPIRALVPFLTMLKVIIFHFDNFAFIQPVTKILKKKK